MNVLILGAGRVGCEIARILVKNQCEVTVVDNNAGRLRQLSLTCELLTIRGNAAAPDVLRQAGASDADLVLSVTNDDAVNLLACKLCALQSQQGGRIRAGSKRIARLSNHAYNQKYITDKNGFDVSQVFSTNTIIAENIVNAIAHPGTFSVNRFADGQLTLAGFRLDSKTDLSGKTISDLREIIPEVEYRIVSVFRDGKPVKPEGKTPIYVGDDIYVLADEEGIRTITPHLTGEFHKNKRIFIAGGGSIGSLVAEKFEKDCEVKIIETDMQTCSALSARFNHAVILRGSATDENILKNEGIAEADIFCALTNFDEENILSAILAKKFKARQTAAIINTATYAEILTGISEEHRLDIAFSPIQIIIGSILANIRLSGMKAVHSLRRGSAEAIEAVVQGNEETSKVVGREVHAVRWPNDVTLGAIVRKIKKEGDDNTDGETQTLIAHDDIEIKDGDTLICFISDSEAIRALEKLLQVDINYI